MKRKLLFMLIWVLIALDSNMGIAQSFTFIETIISNEPAPVYQGQTRVLYACAWQYSINVDVTASGNCGTFEQSFSPGIQFDIITSANITINSNNGTVVNYSMTGANGFITLQLINPCALPPNYLAVPISYSGPVGCAITANTVNFLIKTPEVTFDNFHTTFDGISYGSTTPIMLYKKNDNTLLIRNYDIEINEGHLRHLDFEYTPDLELGPVILLLSAGGNSLPADTVTGFTTISLTAAEISILFPGRNYLMINDVIHVIETSYIDNCSNLPSLDNTLYKVKSICTDFCSTNCNCKVNEMNKAISVSNSINYPYITHQINGGLASNNPIDVCGDIPFDFEFVITNPTFAPGNVANTSIKKLDKIFIPVDLNAFDIENSGSIDADRILFRYNNISLSVNYLIANNIVPANFFNYNATTQQIRFDFSNITNSAIAGAWAGSSPFFNWYDPTKYNDFKESTTFTIILDDLRYQYDKVLTLGTTRYSLDDCHPSAYFSLFADDYFNDFFHFYRMCEVEPLLLTQDMYPEYLTFRNLFEVTGIAEASSADVELGAPVDVEFSFTGPSSGNPWDMYYPASGYNSIKFNCTANTYQAEIIVPDELLINPNSLLVFYPDPNNLNISVNIPVPMPVASNGFLHYVVSLIDQNSVPVHTANGILRANFQMAPCVATTSGFSTVQIKIQNVCNSNCSGFVNTVACFGTELFWRCDGPCCGPPQGTSNFSFDRTTPGYTNNSLSTPVVLDPILHKVNRGYPCDHIAVASEGEFYKLTDSCTVDTNYIHVPAVEDFYFRIEYSKASVLFQFFDFINAYYTTTINGTTSPPINISSNNFDVDTIFSSDTSFVLKFIIASGTDADTLQATGAVVNFYATLKVNEMLTDPPTGFYQLPQIRGQFVGKISSTYEEHSCDDWGDNMTVLNVRTTNNTTLTRSGYANGTYNFPYAAGQCYRRFIIESIVTGGIPGLNEFPNEFRPIALWPEQTDANQIRLTMPPGFSTFTPFTPMAIFFAARESAPGWTWQQANFTANGQILTFNGYGVTNNPWPVLEHDGGKIQLIIAGLLRNECPPVGAPAPIAQFSLPHSKRAFAVDELACQSTTIYNTNDTVPLSKYTLQLNYGQNTIDINQLSGTINGVTVKYRDTIGSTPNIENFWIQNNSSGILINSIQICPVVTNPICTTVTAVNGYFQLGILQNNQLYDLNIDYTLTSCNTGTHFPLSFLYGFSCNGYPPPDSITCNVDSFQVNLNPLPAALSMTAVNPPPITNACSNINYTFDLNSTQSGNVENLTFNATIPASLTLVSAQYNLNGNIGNMTTYNQIGEIYTWELDNNIPGGVSLSQADNLIITITMTGTCASYGQSDSLYFNASGTDICGDSLPNTNNSTHFAYITFPAFNPQTNTCTDCFNCDSLALDIFMNDCEVTFEALIPTNNFCAFSTISWSFGDGTFVNSNSLSAQHIYGNSGIYNVFYTYHCYDSIGDLIDSCVFGETIIVNCDPCEDVFIDVSILDCSIEARADVGNVTGCTNIMYAWSYGDGSFSGPLSLSNATSHTYSSPGQYILCFEAFCYDANGNVIFGCSECDTIYVECPDGKFCFNIEKKYDFDNGSSIAMADDGGFAVAGTIFEKSSGGDKDMYFVKYRPDLTEEFYLRLGDYHDGDYTEEGYSVVVRSDGYYIAGTVFVDSENEDIFVVKINTNGILDWGYRYSYAGESIEFCRKMIDMETSPNDALLIVGGTNAVFGNTDIQALKINPATGAIMEQKIYYQSTTSFEFGSDVVATGIANPQKEYAIVGTYSNDPENERRIVALIVDSDLILQSNGRVFSSGNQFEEAFGVEAFQSKLYLTGYSGNLDGADNLLIMELDGSSLAFMNSLVYSSENYLDQVGREILLDDDKKLIIVGISAIPGGGTPTDGIIIKVDPLNNLGMLWATGYSTNLPSVGEKLLDVVHSSPDFYIVTGSYSGSAINDEDIFIARIGKDGSSCCLNEYALYANSIYFSNIELDKSQNSKLQLRAHGLSKKFYDVMYICPSESRIADSPNVIQTQQGALLIMPNPNSGKFVMQLIDTEQNIKEVRVLDLSGRVILSKLISDANNGQIAIDASSCSDGLYLVEVFSEYSKWTTKVSIAK